MRQGYTPIAIHPKLHTLSFTSEEKKYRILFLLAKKQTIVERYPYRQMSKTCIHSGARNEETKVQQQQKYQNILRPDSGGAKPGALQSMRQLCLILYGSQLWRFGDR